MQTLDQTNLEILKILQKKARIPNIEVSRLINLAPSAVLERIRKMENQGIIDGYEVRLNPEQFDCSLISFVQIHPGHQADIMVIGTTLSHLEEVQEVHYIAGEDCYLIKARTSGIAALDQLLRRKVLTITGVRSTRTFPVLATSKETTRIPISS